MSQEIPIYNISVLNDNLKELQNYLDMGCQKGAYTLEHTQKIFHLLDNLKKAVNGLDTNQQILQQLQKKAAEHKHE